MEEKVETNVKKPRGKALSITALVLGIIALVLCWIPIIPWMIAVAAIVFGILGLVKEKNPMGIAGIVMGTIGLILIPIMLLVLGVGIMTFNAVGEAVYDATYAMETQEVRMFNMQWESYANRTQTSGQIQALINAVNAHNSRSDRRIELRGDVIAGGGRQNYRADGLDSNMRYNVTLEHGREGFVERINVRADS
ncbi:MAG: DUF4190 domain-containing protein [Oscillospiraceae bacterium]|nr:DUF4190 domain-containing protein [Oscillospiraceae bacterium]